MTIGLIAMLATIACCTFGMYMHTRKMRKENTKDAVDNAVWRNTMERGMQLLVETCEKIANRMDINDNEHRQIQEWQIKADNRMNNIEAKAERALQYIDEMRGGRKSGDK